MYVFVLVRAMSSGSSLEIVFLALFITSGCPFLALQLAPTASAVKSTSLGAQGGGEQLPTCDPISSQK